MNNELKKLISELQENTLSPEKYDRLVELFNSTSREEVEDLLWEKWLYFDNKTQFKEMEGVFQLIKKQIAKQPIKKQFLFSKWSKIAAAVLIPVFIVLTYWLSPDTTYKEFRTSAEVGGKSYILLPDSTEVWLNSESELVYTSEFNSKNRMVKLVGEAFFKVKKMSEDKFTVKMNDIDVVVLGTTFNVSSYTNNEEVQVALLEGAVSIKEQETDQLIKLHPNQLFTLNKERKKWSLENVDTSLFGLWRKNRLVFQDTPIKEMYQQLEKWYDLSIKVINHDQTTVYGFTLQGESIEDILDLVNIITPIDYRISGKEVIIRYK